MIASPSPLPALDRRAVALLLAATLTTMANAAISPALPGLEARFAEHPHAALLTRFLVPAPSVAVVLIAGWAGLLADRLGKQGGFALDDIAAMFGPGGRPEILREDVQARAEDMRRQAQRLEALSEMMHHVAVCPAENHMECEKFQQLLRLATRVQRRDAASKA